MKDIGKILFRIQEQQMIFEQPLTRVIPDIRKSADVKWLPAVETSGKHFEDEDNHNQENGNARTPDHAASCKQPAKQDEIKEKQ